MLGTEAEEATRPGFGSGGDDFGGGCENVEGGMGAKSMWEVGLWARCRKRRRGVQLRFATQRSLQQCKLVARTSQ